MTDEGSESLINVSLRSTAAEWIPFCKGMTIGIKSCAKEWIPFCKGMTIGIKHSLRSCAKEWIPFFKGMTVVEMPVGILFCASPFVQCIQCLINFLSS